MIFKKEVFLLILFKKHWAGEQQTIIPGALLRGREDRRLGKQTRLMSSKLNGKPGVKTTGESLHIYCCWDFNTNTTGSASAVSLSAERFAQTAISI